MPSLKIKLFDKNKSGDQDEQRISDSTTYSGFSNSNIINQDCNISALIKNNDSINSQVVSESKMRTTINTLTNSKLSIQYKNSDDINNSGVIKNKDSINSEFSHSRKPLYVNTDDGRISGNPEVAVQGAQEGDLGDRLHKIRSSLDRINALMADLKKLSAHREKEKFN